MEVLGKSLLKHSEFVNLNKADLLVIVLFDCVIVAALLVKWSPAGDSYALAIGTKVVVYKLAVSTRTCTSIMEHDFILFVPT